MIIFRVCLTIRSVIQMMHRSKFRNTGRLRRASSSQPAHFFMRNRLTLPSIPEEPRIVDEDVQKPDEAAGTTRKSESPTKIKSPPKSLNSPGRWSL